MQVFAALGAELVLQLLEAGCTLFVHRNDFAVEHGLADIQRLQHIRDGLVFWCPIEPGAGHHVDFALVDHRQSAIAVKLDFVNPVWPLRNGVRQGGQLGRHELQRLVSLRRRFAFRRRRRGLGFCTLFQPAAHSAVLGFAGMPDLIAGVGDLVHGPVADHAGRHAIEPRLTILVEGLIVAVLDQKPVMAAVILRSRTHAGEHPGPLEPLAMKDEFQVAFLQAFMRIADRLPGAFVPQHDCAAAILAFRDGAFEAAIGHRVVFGLYRQALIIGVGRGAACHRPGLQNAVELKAEVVVQTGRRMFLD